MLFLNELLLGALYLPLNSQPERVEIDCWNWFFRFIIIIIIIIIAKRIFTHLEEQSLLPAEQKGCHPGSKGCKDQLMISKAIYEDYRRRNKNLSIYPGLITRKHLIAFHIAGWKSQ